jgi:hypothetical protein
MARLIDERLETEEQEVEVGEGEVIGQLTEEPVVEETPQPAEDEVPEKYKGKSTAEIVRMHQEAEKLLGRQSSEVGELRSVVDNYIQTQLDTTSAPKEEPEEEVDFFSDPEGAVARAIKNHPSIKQAEEVSQQYKKSTAQNHLQSRHPDMQNILTDSKFVDWIKGSKIRTKLFAQADTQYDYEAADELFSTWKERQGTVAQTAANEKAVRKTAVKSASTGNAQGSGETSSRKIYRRSDIIKLMTDDPDRYLALSDEIMLAYQEKRVRN